MCGRVDGQSHAACRLGRGAEPSPLSAEGPAPVLYATAPPDGFVLDGIRERIAYSFDTAIDHVASIPILTAGVVAGTFVIGIADWKWGSASFHFTNEGFFGKDTHDLGMDKLGHAFGTYVLLTFSRMPSGAMPPTLRGPS